jgi:hypothetical protein
MGESLTQTRLRSQGASARENVGALTEREVRHREGGRFLVFAKRARHR